MTLVTDFRLTLNKDTQLCMSLASRPGNFGTRLHNFLYARLDLDFVYKSFTTQNLEHAVAGIRALGIRGCAISMPFKEAVIPLLDRLESSAERIAAVNTIVNDGGNLTGLNTDYIAIQRIFERYAIPADTRIVVLGSGGMAKAIVAALDASGYRDVTIVARNTTTGRELGDQYGFPWHPEVAGAERFDVIVNATPVGMAPHPDDCPCPNEAIAAATWVVDCIANPVQTQLIEAATHLGKRTVTGFEITVLQSIEQFTLYTGVVPAPADIQAAEHYLQSFAA